MGDLCDDLSSKHLLSEILIRNRKAVVGGFMPRRAHRWKVELTQAEIDALDLVEDHVARGYAAASEQSDNSIGFLMVAYQKMMASSIAALRVSLAGRRDRLRAGDAKARGSSKELRELADEDSDLGAEAAGQLAALGDAEADELDILVDALEALPIDSKAETLRSHMATIKDEAEVAKVLIFTEFRATQDHLAEVLRSSGWNVSLFHGQLKPEQKDRAVEAFRDDSKPHVLISTEAGGEGRNFQFCSLVGQLRSSLESDAGRAAHRSPTESDRTRSSRSSTSGSPEASRNASSMCLSSASMCSRRRWVGSIRSSARPSVTSA